MLLFWQQSTGPGLSEFADVAQVVIAIVNLFFAAYLLLHGLRKEERDKHEKQQADKEAVKLAWFKELVIQPQLPNFFNFFDIVLNTAEAFRNAGLTDDEKSRVLTTIKDRQSLLRRQLIDLMRPVNINMHRHFIETLDKLVDEITADVFAGSIDLSDRDIYTERLTNKILLAKATLIERMMNYHGE